MDRSDIRYAGVDLDLVGGNVLDTGQDSKGVFIGGGQQAAGVVIAIPLLASDTQVEYSS